MGKSELDCFQREHIPIIWPQVRLLIKKALDRGSNYTIDEIYWGLINKDMQLWASVNDGRIEAALVTTIQIKDGVKFLRFLTLGGENMKEWKRFMPIVEKWAKDSGCTKAVAYGRIGWARQFGFNVEFTKMSKSL